MEGAGPAPGGGAFVEESGRRGAGFALAGPGAVDPARNQQSWASRKARTRSQPCRRARGRRWPAPAL